MNKFKYLYLFVLIMLFPISVFGEDCTNYELDIAKSDYGIEKVLCFNDYASALAKMNELEERDLIIRDISNNSIIDAKYGIAVVSKGNDKSTINLYQNASTNSAYTYVVGGSSYASSDAAYLGLDFNSKRAHILLSGFDGYVNKFEYDVKTYEIVPIAWIKSTNYYVVNDNEIIHYKTFNVNQDNNYMSTIIGPKPSMLNPGTYYSFDGNYFYSNIYVMLYDYKLGIRLNSVNKDNPYYNYYMYLPVHSKTTYSASEINNLIRHYYGSTYSYLNGLGYAFYYSQENYGMNALTNLSLAVLESGSGKSAISRNKYNLFGHGAVDSNPSEGAATYALPEMGVYDNAFYWYTYGYSFPSDSRFYGGQLGNKVNGANVKYSSDPYWGEKIGAKYYEFDKYLGLQDYNYYSIIEKSANDKVYPTSTIGGGIISVTDRSDNTYNYVKPGETMLLLEEIDNYYRIQSDTNIDENGNYLPRVNHSNYNFIYNKVYVPKSSFKKIITGTNVPTDVTSYVESRYRYVYYTNGINPNFKGAITNNKINVYSSPSLDINVGTVEKGQYVVVYAEAYDENNKLKSYLVSYNYQTADREWVSPNDITFVSGNYGRIIITSSGAYVNVRSSAAIINGNNSNVIGSMPGGSYFIVFETQTVNNMPWYKVSYRDNDTNYTGWVCKDDEQYVNMFTLNTSNIPVNNSPVINASNVTIYQGDNFNPLNGVSATDTEDGNITNKITYTGTVDTTKVGSYNITYLVTDSNGATTTKIITVTVISKYKEGNSLYAYESIKYVNENIFEFAGFLAVEGINNSTSNDVKHYIVFKNELNGLEHEYLVANWLENHPTDFDSYGTKYNAGWFKGNIDITNLPEGDYTIMVKVVTDNNTSTVVSSNSVYGDMPTKVTYNGRGYSFSNNFYNRYYPTNLSVRNNGLITSNPVSLTNQMYNYFETLTLDGTKLNILGLSYNYGIAFDSSTVRSMILENTSTFERFEYNLVTTNKGLYQVELRRSDNLSKEYAWYNGSIELGNLPKGTYAVYIKTTVGSYTNYGELQDIGYYTFPSNNNIVINRVDAKRMRVEITIK